MEESSNIEGDESKKTYQYDNENQLINSEHKQGQDIKTYTYEYDVTGNRTKQTENINGVITAKQYRFDTSNKLLEVEGTTGDLNVKYTYDTGGNVTKKENKGTGLVEEFTYNAEGKLLEIKNNLGKTIQYTYDGLGNRTEKVETTTMDKHNMKHYLEVLTSDGAFNDEFDAALSLQQTKELLSNLKETMEEYTKTYNQVCPEVEKNGKKESTITYNYVNDVNLAYTEVLQVNGEENKPLHTYIYGVQRIQDDKRGERTQYYNYDGKGSVIGKQVGNDLHLAFKVKYNDDGKPSRNMDNEFGYNGEAHDYHGTQYLRARYYDTNIGRFNQRDPYRGELHTPISQNRYTYVWNNALKYEDKSGNRLLLDTGGEDYALEEAIIRDDLFHTQYTNGTMTESEYYKHSATTWDDYRKGDNKQNITREYVQYLKDQAELAARREYEAMMQEKNSLEKQLKDAGIKYSWWKLTGYTPEQQLKILREIKKICEELGMGTERFDKNKAQQAVDNYVAKHKKTIFGALKEWTDENQSTIATIGGVVFAVIVLGTGGLALAGGSLGTVVLSNTLTSIFGTTLTVSGANITTAGLVSLVAGYINMNYILPNVDNKYAQATLQDVNTFGMLFGIGGLASQAIDYLGEKGQNWLNRDNTKDNSKILKYSGYKSYENLAKDKSANELIKELNDDGWNLEITKKSDKSGPTYTFTNQDGIKIRIHPNPSNGKPYFRVQNSNGNYLDTNGVFPSDASKQEMRDKTHFYFRKD